MATKNRAERPSDEAIFGSDETFTAPKPALNRWRPANRFARPVAAAPGFLIVERPFDKANNEQVRRR